ncbi:alcohol dehydrogenase catalytic domain-containing protein [Candidatus Sumerlaeota bacterium]|nr:alcohol dehydrogenase catalytic domain-containing protein [Candidatus Sumerlaeota bacterium]
MGRSNRAVRLHGPRVLKFHDEPCPKPGLGEVLLEVLSVGICRSDLDYWNDGRIGDAVVTEPLILGHEFSARIVEAGEGVDAKLVGQRVAVEPAVCCTTCEWCRRGDTNLCPTVRFCGTPPVDGAFCRYMAYPAEFLAVLRDDISDDAGAVLEPLAIGVHVLDLARPRLGQAAAIVGCGAVGLSILQAARLAGMGRLIALDCLQWRLDLAAALGATDAISVEREDPVAALDRLTGERGVDLVFEAAGSDESPALSMNLAAPGGKVFLVGIPPSDQIVFSAGVSRRRGLTVYVVRRSRNTLHRALSLLERGLLEADRLVTHRFPLSQCERAFAMTHNYEDNVVKTIIRIRES